MLNQRNNLNNNRTKTQAQLNEDLVYEKFNRGFYEEALLEFRKLPPSWRTAVGQAKCYLKLNDYQNAILCLEPLIKKSNTSMKVYTLLASAYVGLQQYDKALKVLELSPNKSGYEFQYAKVSYLAFIDLEKSLELFNKIPMDSRNETELALLKANILHNSGDINQELEHYYHTLQKFPNNIKLRKAYANALFLAKDFLNAEKEIKQCLQQNQDDPSLIKLLKRIQYHSRDTSTEETFDNLNQKAAKLKSDLIQNLPINPSFAFLIIHELRDQDQFNLGLQIAELLEKQHPANVDVQMALLTCLIYDKKFNLILQQVQKLAKNEHLAPNKRVHVAILLEQAYIKTNDQLFSDEAIEILSALIKTNDECIYAKTTLARIFEDNNRLAEARSIMEDVVKVNQDLWSAHLSYSIICEHDGSPEISIEVLNNLCEAYTSNNNNTLNKPTRRQYAQALNNLSVIYSNEPSHIDLKLAKELAKKAKITDAQFDSASSQLGHLIDNRRQSENLFNNARSVRPERLDELHPTVQQINKIEVVEKKTNVTPVNAWTKSPIKSVTKEEKSLITDSDNNFPSLSQSTQSLFQKNQSTEKQISPTVISKNQNSKLNPNAEVFVSKKMNANVDAFVPKSLQSTAAKK